MKAERLVIDTNVLISAALLQPSPPAALLAWALRERRLLFSQATFAELETRLWRAKFDRYITLESRKRLLHDLASAADWVQPAEGARHSRDADDDKFVHLALAGAAPWLISGDRDLLVLQRVHGVTVLSVAQALARLP